VIQSPQIPTLPSKKESEEGPGEEHNEEDDKEGKETKETQDNDTEKSGVRKRVSNSKLVEGVCGIRSWVTLDVMSSTPFVSQANKREFGRRI